jgi:hypothetical protein
MVNRLSSSSTRAVHLAHGLVIIVVAALLSFPYLLVGIPEGYDSTIHTMYQYHFDRQFWSGDLYPRWLAEANKGYGSPIFLVQYPLPYFITALLRPILSFPPLPPESHVSLEYIAFSRSQPRAFLPGSGFAIATV